MQAIFLNIPFMTTFYTIQMIYSFNERKYIYDEEQQNIICHYLVRKTMRFIFDQVNSKRETGMGVSTMIVLHIHQQLKISTKTSIVRNCSNLLLISIHFSLYL